MAQDGEEEFLEGLGAIDPEIQRLIGTFDAPAFARRGQDLERNLVILDSRCGRARLSLLDMVHLRLRQWAEVSTSFHDYADQFEHPLDRLYEQAQVPQPTWGALPGSPRRRATVARELAASAARFNRRWAEYVNQLDFRPINRVIEHYNAYYTLEKECSLGSTRLATRYFKAVEPITVDSILRTHPFLDEPKMRRA